jgi:hypothetical protein
MNILTAFAQFLTVGPNCGENIDLRPKDQLDWDAPDVLVLEILP